jgi:hypothetical protein
MASRKILILFLIFLGAVFAFQMVSPVSVVGKSSKSSGKNKTKNLAKELKEKWGWPGDFNEEEKKLMRLSMQLENLKWEMKRWPEKVKAAREKSKT